MDMLKLQRGVITAIVGGEKPPHRKEAGRVDCALVRG
jgi:hypothetical protein